MRLVTILFLFISYWALGQNGIERVEPPNWWVGMKTNNIQLLVYGKGIGKFRPSIQYPGVHIIKSTVVENANYLFIDIGIHETAKAGAIPIEFVGEDNQQFVYNWSLEDRAEGRADLKSFDASDAIYLITPDRYKRTGFIPI